MSISRYYIEFLSRILHSFFGMLLHNIPFVNTYFNIHVFSTGQSFFCTCHEILAKKGVNEEAFIHYFVNKCKINNLKNITITFPVRDHSYMDQTRM